MDRARRAWYLPGVSKKKPVLGDEQGLAFEDALAEIEAIIDRIESGKVGLEQSIAEYERGAKLVKRCREVLQRAELRVQELTGSMPGASGRSDSSSPPDEADDAAGVR
ncbi:MAG: exodeoxyribonuclease VII small subunit [Phycisphaeraceae bacterium]|nr:exodeoxyribonuclease VII small subunit [Phycisphaeraceae bacterium]MCW5753622.1 exodeoxyribonuclease VII small subunit [Phycisphaeraceae bacterium]